VVAAAGVVALAGPATAPSMTAMPASRRRFIRRK
jgi:hypothetical protein